jgi:hypothetical protein
MCVLSVDPNDTTGTTFLVNPAGIVTIEITSLIGTVIFSPKGTTVTDSAGKQIAGTSFPAPDSYSFPTSAGQTYTLETEYVCLPPNSTGTLDEACAGGVKLGDIFPSTNGQVFTIKA